MEKKQKINRINELLELKEVTVQDDYFTDIFNDKNGNMIFSVMSSRGFEKHPEKEIPTLDEIITKLENYEEKPA